MPAVTTDAIERAQPVEVGLAVRHDERLAGQHQREQHHQPARQAEDADAGHDEHLDQHQHQAGDEHEDFERLGRAFEVLAPEEQDERHRRHDAADADAGRLELDVHADEAEEQQERGEPRRRQGLHQRERPVRLDGFDLSEAVQPLELVEVVDRLRRQRRAPRPARR